MVEETVATGKKAGSSSVSSVPGSGQKPMPLSHIDSSVENRMSLNNAEVDRILGGGLVEGSLVLIGGEPGIGKSTLSLQIPLHCPQLKTLYVTGEESAKQVKLRASRIGGDDSNCFIYSETLMENIIAEARAMMPDLVVVDSVQTMFSQNVESSPGSVTQIRETAAMLLRFAKETGVPVILIGHITKDCRSEDSGTYRRCRPAVRRRQQRHIQASAQHKEPFWIDFRARCFRDDGKRAERSEQSFRIADSDA